MGKEVIWSVKADESFDAIIEYLKTEWSFKEVEKFTKDVLVTVNSISIFPQMFAEFHDRNIRKALINPNIYMLYKISNEHIELLTFWNNKQDPSKLKNIIN